MAVISDNHLEYDFPTNGDNLLLVTASGTVTSGGNAIDGSFTNGGIYIVNDGTVFGAANGVAAYYNNTVVSNNSDGKIIGETSGVRILADGARLTNEGTISGGTVQGVHLEGKADSVQNLGTITGPIGIYLNVKGGVGTIVNSGLITGDDVAVYKEGGGTLSFRNTGKIDGGVTFIDGVNTFNGRDGTVTGTITGGSGVDTIIAGNDGETINGGKGHDKLYAGTGADTFAFTSYSSPDYDHISHFDVAKDTIQLDHTVFTRLVAETTPVFSIASAPTSASDLLYYNSSTGGLYYDPDGSGTKYHGYAVAVLDKGLALAAKDFTVV